MTRHATAVPASLSLSVSSAPVRQPGLLLVDDDRTALSILTHLLKGFNYTVTTARSGEEGLEALFANLNGIDAIILDREMPGLNGMQVVERIKDTPAAANIPIIMLTGSGKPEQIQEGIDAGVFYYLVKPVEDTLLKSIVGSAVQEKRSKELMMSELIRHDAALKAMRTCQIEVRTIREAEDTASFLACCFPEPERIVAGLLELLVNAVEHGNLGITYEEKTALLNRNGWMEEIERRLAMPEYRDKAVDVIYQHKPEGWFIQIKDCGKGFDWRRYWQIDPSRATATHGRGIARARLLAFDKLSYNDAGNQVTAVIHQTKKDTLDW